MYRSREERCRLGKTTAVAANAPFTLISIDRRWLKVAETALQAGGRSS
ncbi:hypothetical protein [Streptomyces sp. NBC_01236]|nr:hypothetical protein OG324_27285 [Streptomyces sp. NBC_01236]